MLIGETFAVHLVSKDDPVLPGEIERDRIGIVVAGAEGDESGRRLDACHVQHHSQRDALPERAAHKVATDLVADALEGSVLLNGRHGENIGVLQVEHCFYGAADTEVPAIPVDGGVYQVL